MDEIYLARRLVLLGIIAAPVSGCADVHNYWPCRPFLNQTQVLAMLPSFKTEAPMIAAFGPPNYSVALQDALRRLTDERGTEKMFPPNLLATVPPQAKVLRYKFTDGDSINPWGPDLDIFVDPSGQILGWSTGLVDKRYRFSHQNEGHPAPAGGLDYCAATPRLNR